MSTELVVSFEVDGYHYWPGAPEKYKEFGQPHRHIFKFICLFSTEDSHDPARRQIELWELRQNCLDYVRANYQIESFVCDFKDMSCEGIAEDIIIGMGASAVFVGEEYWLGAWVRA